jgi:hypothetical protein
VGNFLDASAFEDGDVELRRLLGLLIEPEEGRDFLARGIH